VPKGSLLHSAKVFRKSDNRDPGTRTELVPENPVIHMQFKYVQNPKWVEISSKKHKKTGPFIESGFFLFFFGRRFDYNDDEASDPFGTGLL
jgi:hypothetical protein